MDFVLQLGSQEYAHRVQTYASSSQFKLFYPKNHFCKDTIELGPRTDHNGPAMVLFKDCSATPAEVAQLVENTFLRRYTTRIYICGHSAPDLKELVTRTLVQIRELEQDQGTHTAQVTSSNSESPLEKSTEGKRIGEDCSFVPELPGRNWGKGKYSKYGGISGILSKYSSLTADNQERFTLNAEESSGNPKKAKISEESNTFSDDLSTDEYSKQTKVQSNEEKTQNYDLDSAKLLSIARNISRDSITERQKTRGFEYGGDQRLTFKAGDPVCLRLQCYPKALTQWMIDNLPESVQIHPKKYTHTLSVIQCEEGIFYGILPAADTWLNPSDRLGSTTDFASKAVCKLEEAILVSGIQLTNKMTAIDVGASPGAWSEFLASRIHHVVAIDPAKLDPKLISNVSNVTHIQKKVEDAVEDLRESGLFDIIVCDVNRHPLQAVTLLLPLLPVLREGGSVIMTMKFRGKGRVKDSCVTEEVASQFGPAIVDAQCVWLLANSVYERTFIARKSTP